jgi:hypothetical protein
MPENNDTPPQVVKNNVIKFSDEELKELTEIREAFDKATVSFGRLYLRKLEVQRTETEMNSELSLLESQEKEFLKKINAKYGDGTFDPVNNVFTPTNSQ